MKRVAGAVAIGLALGCSHPVPNPTRPLAQPVTTSAAIVTTGPVQMQTSADQMRAFVLDVPPFDEGGECTIARPNGAGTTLVAAYFPTRHSPKALVNLTFDPKGAFVQYTETRGVMHFALPPAATPAKRDSVRDSVVAATRSTSISLDYPMDRGTVMNRGGGQPSNGILGPVATIIALPQVGDVMKRLERVRTLCGV